jgi:hypothetical protein
MSFKNNLYKFLILADYLLDSIDQTVNPCEDFYHFACGTWLKTARIPEDSMFLSFSKEANPTLFFLGGVQNIFNLLDTQLDINLIGLIENLSQIIFFIFVSYSDLLSTPSSNGTIDPQAVVNARNLYSSCTNETTIEMDDVTAVLSIVNNEFGGWPILQGAAWNSSVFNLTDLLLKLRQYDNEIIFSVATATDQQNSSAYDIEVRDHDCLLKISFETNISAWTR